MTEQTMDKKRIEYPGKIEHLKGNRLLLTFRDIPQAIGEIEPEDDFYEAARETLRVAIDQFFENDEIVPLASPLEPGDVAIEIPRSYVERISRHNRWVTKGFDRCVQDKVSDDAIPLTTDIFSKITDIETCSYHWANKAGVDYVAAYSFPFNGKKYFVSDGRIAPATEVRLADFKNFELKHWIDRYSKDSEPEKTYDDILQDIISRPDIAKEAICSSNCYCFTNFEDYIKFAEKRIDVIYYKQCMGQLTGLAKELELQHRRTLSIDRGKMFFDYPDSEPAVRTRCGVAESSDVKKSESFHANSDHELTKDALLKLHPRDIIYIVAARNYCEPGACDFMRVQGTCQDYIDFATVDGRVFHISEENFFEEQSNNPHISAWEFIAWLSVFGGSNWDPEAKDSIWKKYNTVTGNLYVRYPWTCVAISLYEVVINRWQEYDNLPEFEAAISKMISQHKTIFDKWLAARGPMYVSEEISDVGGSADCAYDLVVDGRWQHMSSKEKLAWLERDKKLVKGLYSNDEKFNRCWSDTPDPTQEDIHYYESVAKGEVRRFSIHDDFGDSYIETFPNTRWKSLEILKSIRRKSWMVKELKDIIKKRRAYDMAHGGDGTLLRPPKVVDFLEVICLSNRAHGYNKLPREERDRLLDIYYNYLKNKAECSTSKLYYFIDDEHSYKYFGKDLEVFMVGKGRKMHLNWLINLENRIVDYPSTYEDRWELAKYIITDNYIDHLWRLMKTFPDEEFPDVFRVLFDNKLTLFHMNRINRLFPEFEW